MSTSTEIKSGQVSTTTSSKNEELFNFGNDDIFNLNSFNNEEYFLNIKKRKKEKSRSNSRNRRSSSSLSNYTTRSSSYNSTSSHESRLNTKRSKSKNVETKKSSSTSSSSSLTKCSSRSSSWSSSSSDSSSCSDSKRKKLKSKVVLVINNNNRDINNELENSRRSDNRLTTKTNDHQIWPNNNYNYKREDKYYDYKYNRSYQNEISEFMNQPNSNYKPRFVCTPPLPTSMPFEQVYQEEVSFQIPNSYHNNMLDTNKYYNLNSIHSSSCLPQNMKYMTPPKIESKFPMPYQFRPLSPESSLHNSGTVKYAPLNQYQEVSSTNSYTHNQSELYKYSQNFYKSNENIPKNYNSNYNFNNHEINYTLHLPKSPLENKKHDEVEELHKNEDNEDLYSIKMQLQQQLKQRLFNSNDNKQIFNLELNKRKAEQKSLSSSLNESSFSSSSSNQNKSPKRKKKRSKKEHRKEDRNKEKYRNNHVSRKKINKRTTISNDESSENDESNSNLRRSDRIKTIETIKQHHKVMKIAEKIKNHNGTISSNILETMEIITDINETSPMTESIGNTIENRTIEINSKKGAEVQENLNNTEDTNEYIPIKVKDRWRRYSEKEYDSSSPNANFQNPVVNSFISLESNEHNSNFFSPGSLLIKSNNFLNSPSNSVSGTSSPRAYKKMLLNKAVNELATIQASNKTNNFQNDERILFKQYNNKENNITGTDSIVPIENGFEWIDENCYLCKRAKLTKFNKDAKRMVCDCSTSQQERSLGISACGDDCLNRLLMIECGNNCPCDDFCTNKNFKTKNNAPILPFKTEMKGWGLKTNADLKPNTFLIEYVGEVIDLKEFKKRFEKYVDLNIEHFYFMSLQNDLFIDATRKGNIARYFNHSCDPNCETQKWTVNGQLRIGFFTRRPVNSNEELTFDYQFQTVGKKQQKCYCGSEKCRGYLGLSEKQQQSKGKTGGMLDYIWEDDSSDEENSESEYSEEENKNNKNSLKHHKTKSYENQNKDYDLNRQIDSISSLKNKESILKLCQLMFRTENIQSRIHILNLLLNANSELSLHLFMDYHGLKLLCDWMFDIDNSYETEEQIDCKIKIIQVLSSLTIKNRTTIEECKLLMMVKRWSDNIENKTYKRKSNNSSDEQKEENETWIREILFDLVDNIFELKNTEKDEITIKIDELAKITKELYEKWNNLKQAFKIPKKQRIEERKEHERELNDSYQTTNLYENNKIEDQNFNIGNYRNNYSLNKYGSYFRRNNHFHTFNNINKFNRFQTNKSSFINHHQPQYYNPSNGLTKEQRRQLFEEKVKKDEEEAARIAEEAANVAAEQALENQKNQELKWVFDKTMNQWIQCYVPVNMDNNSLNNMQYLEMNQTLPSSNIQLAVVNQQLMPPPNNLPSRFSQFVDLNATSIINPLQNSTIQNHLNNLNLTESNFHDLKQAVKLFMPENELVENDSKQNFVPTPMSPLNSSKSLKKVSSNIKLQQHALNKKVNQAKLPPNWKCKINKKGQIYYFNLKTKKSQWHFPKNKSVNETTDQKTNISLSSCESLEKKPDETLVITSNTCDGNSSFIDTTSNKIDQTTGELSSTTNTNEPSSNTFKLYKDQFRDKLSKLVIKLLEVYLKDDCKYGRIKNTDDFKHLARKFTHTIMEKELSRVTKLEELDLNKRVKIKTQEYINQYMITFKNGYSRKTDQ